MNLTLDGVDVPFRQGQTILEAAREAEIYIPALCAHKDLPAFGACRLCIVKVDGMRGFPPSCTTPATDGMVVHTEDDEVMQLRRNVMKLILTEHPHSCIVCDLRDKCEKQRGGPVKAGRITGCSMCPNRPTCEIRQVCDYLGMADMDIPMEYKHLPLERYDPFFDRDYNLCILCGRCVRTCQQVRGVGAIAFTKRSHETKVGTIFGRTHLEGLCRFCGACIDACPTGALSAKGSKWHGKPDTVTGSLCAFCSVNCSMILEEKWGRVMAAVPDREKGVSRGYACVYGRFCIPAFVNGPRRLRYPLIRKGGKLAPVSWERAFQFIGDSLKRFSPEEIGFLISPYLTNESAYLIQRFAREVVGCHNIDILSPFGRVVMQFLADNGEVASGLATLQDVEEADWLMLVNNDIVFSHPAIPVSVHKARERGANIIIVDEEKNDLDVESDMHVRIEPGSIRTFFGGLLKVLMENIKGKESETIEGLDNLRNSLEGITYEWAAKLTGVPKERFQEIVEILLSSKKGVIMLGSRILEDPEPYQILAGIRNIMVHLSMERSFLPLLEEGNIKGVCNVGCLSGFKPGYKKERIRVMDFPRMMAGIRHGDVKALFVSEGTLSPESVRGVKFLVLSEIYPSDLDGMADVILPSAAFTEEEGHYISLENREWKLERAVDPPGMAMPEWKIAMGLAQSFGGEGFDYDSVDDIHQEMSEAIPSYTDGERPSFPSNRRLIPLKELWRINIGEYPPQVAHFRGMPVHELVKDLRIYLEANNRIPKEKLSERTGATPTIEGGGI